MRTCFLVPLLLMVTTVSVEADDTPEEIRFRRDVLPILRDRCLECHGKKASGDLRIDSSAALRAGGASGPVIVAGDADSSELLHRVLQPEESDLRMPPQGTPLSPQQIDMVRQWINDGAAWPEGLVLESIESRAADHWAFQPIRRPVAPLPDDSSRIRNPIDAFVEAGLESADLAPLPEADRMTLLRRVTLDLTGLPPSTDQMDEFLHDQAPDAYERAVDRLLASPRYGERWARPWLDLCHFADTDGYLTDQARPVAWRYRQWLISALNQDLPFDQFTIQQLAGDLLPDPTMEQLLATGFLRNTLSNREGGADLEEFRVEQIVDRTTIVGTGWLGLTVGCARCHDHKYDPIRQRDFFSLYAILDQADEVNIAAPLPGEQSAFQATWQAYRRQRDELIAPIRDELDALQFEWEDRMLEAVANPGADPLWDRQWEVLGLI
ncbi:MAG: DUF1549 domain-containing protein, partial [Planctomycetaceae bacterium]|nr:DUF1549 domain-containing protein [Planctomycetaceae bacterium]